MINYDFPQQVCDYVHRVGRTGRAGASGTSFTFFEEEDARNAKEFVQLLRTSGVEIPRELENMARDYRDVN